MPLTPKYTTAPFTGLVQALQYWGFLFVFHFCFLLLIVNLIFSFQSLTAVYYYFQRADPHFEYKDSCPRDPRFFILIKTSNGSSCFESMPYRGKSNAIKVRNTEGAIRKDDSEKLATYDTQDEEKQNKNTTQYVLDTTMSKQTQIT